MTDLTRALRDLQEGAAGAAGPAPVETVLARRRRRRVVRTSVIGATSVAAASALVLGGLTVLGDRDPHPPAQLPGLVSPVWLGEELPACGAPLDLGDPTSSWAMSADVPEHIGDVGPAGRSVDVDAALASGGDEYVASGGSGRGAALVLAQDGVVVARGTTAAPGRAVEVTPDAPADVGFTTLLEPCGEQPLEPGTYDAWTALELRWEWGQYPDGREAVADSSYGWLAVAGTITVGDDPTAQEAEAAVVLPTGDPTLEFGVCGSTADGVPAPVDDVAVTLSVGDATAATGTPVQVVSTMYPDAALAVLPEHGPDLVVLRDGVVVGVTSVHGRTARSQGSSHNWGHGHEGTHHGAPVLEVCDDGAGSSAGLPLPPGEYEVRALAAVTPLVGVVVDDVPDHRLNDVDWLLAHPSSRRTTVVSPAVSLTVTEASGESGAPDEPAWSGFPAAARADLWEWCGTPGPDDVENAFVTLAVDPAPIQLPTTPDEVPRTGHLTYTGPGRALVATTGVAHLVLRDGVVVGVSGDPGSGFQPWWMSRGGTADLRAFTPVRCDGGTGGFGPLAPGEYDVLPLVSLWVERVVEADGTTHVPDEDPLTTLVTGEATTLTVVDAAWAPADPADLPAGVVVPEADGVPQVERYGDLALWRVEGAASGGRATADAARDAMVAAGFVQEWWADGAADDMPMHLQGRFVRPGLRVEVLIEGDRTGATTFGYTVVEHR